MAGKKNNARTRTGAGYKRDASENISEKSAKNSPSNSKITCNFNGPTKIFPQCRRLGKVVAASKQMLRGGEAREIKWQRTGN